jgi:cell division protein ZapA
MTMKQLEVQIMGQSYLLGCPEGGDASLLDAVSRVDLAMCRIRDAGKVKARDRIAVLAALNLAFDAQTRESAAAAALLTASPVASTATLTVPAPPSTEGDGAARDAATADPQQTPGMTSIESARLLALIERLDTAFGDDGQLL